MRAEEEPEAILIKVGEILNSWPLKFAYNDPDYPVPIMPAGMIGGRHVIASPQDWDRVT